MTKLSPLYLRIHARENGIYIYSIKDGFELSDSLNSKIIAFAFSVAAKKAAGVKLGHPVGKSKDWYRFQQQYKLVQKLKTDGNSLGSIA